MPTIYTAYASEAKVDEEPLEGLQSIEYRQIKNRHDVGAIGTDERIGVYFGLKVVAGNLRIASASTTLDRLLAENKPFTLSVTLRHGDTSSGFRWRCATAERPPRSPRRRRGRAS